MLRAAVAEQALMSQQRSATANHTAAAPPPTIKPEVTSSALLSDRKQRNTGAGAFQQLNVTDFRVASTIAAGLLLTTVSAVQILKINFNVDFGLAAWVNGRKLFFLCPLFFFFSLYFSLSTNTPRRSKR